MDRYIWRAWEAYKRLVNARQETAELERQFKTALKDIPKKKLAEFYKLPGCSVSHSFFGNLKKYWAYITPAGKIQVKTYIENPDSREYLLKNNPAIDKFSGIFVAENTEQAKVIAENIFNI